MSSSTEARLNYIFKDIEPYLNINKKEFFNELIKSRLTLSLRAYKNALDISYAKLMTYCEKHDIKLLGRLSKNDRCD